MDVDEEEVIKKAPAKVKASAKRGNVSSGARTVEEKSEETPAKVEGSKAVPKFKCATF